jgi:L-lactate utilization protein LutB
MLEILQLAGMPFESRFQSIEKPVNLDRLRSDSLRTNGAKDVIGLLGINAISAKEGDILFFQHMHNISKVYTQAREIVLVAGLDKIVNNLEDALFHTRCMAAFGVEVLPLTLPDQTSKSSLDELPFEIPYEEASVKIHLIVLDNGRTQVRQSAYRDVLTCIDCQACTRSCPTSKYFSEGLRWSPRTYLYTFVTGRNPSLKYCLQCKSCETNCPLGIEIPDMILEAKNAPGQPHSLTDSLIANAGSLEKAGSSIAGLTNTIMSNQQLRWMGEKMFNISRERRLPQFKRQTLVKWYKSRRGNN